MFRNLEAEIIRKNLNKRELAAQCGMSYNTFLLKLKGRTYFTLDEALRIKEILVSAEPVEILFKKSA